MSLAAGKRQKSEQLELPLGTWGEAPGSQRSGETAAATQGTERSGTDCLMEEVVERDNALKALKRVRKNKGSPGVDGMTVDELPQYLKEHWGQLRAQLLAGTFQPQAVLRQEVEKSGGGMRILGIPRVVDRFIQQAILQVLQPRFDPTFSEHSYGFRPGRGAHDAVKAARLFIQEGRGWVVDLDLEKFFDRVQHDVLRVRVARRVKDKRVPALIGRFLRAGMMQNGVCVRREEGTPQGGPLSPLLANLLLDDLDKELEKRGHRFCRYADDCNIYVKSEAAGQRVLASVTEFLEKQLKLKVNRPKSAVGHVRERKFLGYRRLEGGALGVAPQSQEKLKGDLRELTRRNGGQSLEQVIGAVNEKLTGWIQYFHLAQMKSVPEDLSQWLRRRGRSLKLKQCRRTYAIARFLMKEGESERSAWRLALSGKGWWRLADTPQAHRAMSLSWFREHGLIDPEAVCLALQNAGR
jgi:RNA-directed DNA polymerase